MSPRRRFLSLVLLGGPIAAIGCSEPEPPPMSAETQAMHAEEYKKQQEEMQKSMQQRRGGRR